MSRFLGCGCTQRPHSELEPIVWAGFRNEWRRVPEITDEFRGTQLNHKKWFPYSPYSFGTKPGLFVPGNVSTRDQVLHLTAKCNGLPQGAPTGYAKWTTAAICSRKALLYGYFECCFRASKTALASRFCLVNREDAADVEVDVFSYSSIGKHKELVYMDARFSQTTDGGEVHEVSHPLKKVIFDMPESPVTVGIDWTPDYLKTYVDGHMIRHLENKHWHSPMRVSFKLETVPEDFGMPEHRDLGERENFEIYYIRAWHRYPTTQQKSAPGISRV